MTNEPHNGTQPDPTTYLTLAEAARHAPGHPSPNCLWRWCRRGVLARGGKRVHLHHIRSGGKMYTKVAWVEAFCRELTEADQAYFEAKRTARASLPPRDDRYAPQGKASAATKAASGQVVAPEQSELERELREEGL